ncbi:V4R domain-containing protein [Oceanobacillus longus]|uniref:V4R domain-containing protein n=1 Tax=Oceanobacillus longus TaxID=930120 RepID=A0ABV8H3M4_9BACI
MNEITHLDNFDHSDIVITSESFGILRKALFEHMGKEKAKAFLMRFGKVLGENKAKEVIDSTKPINDILGIVESITNNHVSLGHVSNVEYDIPRSNIEDNQIIFNEKAAKSKDPGKWKDSFEVKLHLKHFGIADECTCYTLSGYASGSLSVIFNQEIFVKELTCRSKGDADCTFEVNTKEYWERNSQDYLPIYDDQSILNELEITYDTLLSQKKLLERITDFHVQLTESVIEQNSIDEVVKAAYQILKVPIVIEELNGNIISKYGIEKVEFNELISNKKIIKERKHRTNVEQINNSYLMSTPIYLDDKALFTCYFVYEDMLLYDKNDYLFLERLSTVSTLCFINEKISFETTERLKINILDRLIQKQYISIDEISSQLKYITNEITDPYITLMFECSTKESTNAPIDLYEKVIQISNTLKIYSLDGLLSNYKDKIVILIFSVNKTSFQKRINQVLSHSQKIDNEYNYKVGISSVFDDLTHFHSSLEQAEQAVNLPRSQNVIQFDELGLLGTFLQGINVNDLKNTANKELGRLLDSNDRNKELLYTLYIYLINGGKLEKTMKDLSLSIGGIQYRIRKIEEIIEKDLKDFTNASYLLLIIESLISIGEIKI